MRDLSRVVINPHHSYLCYDNIFKWVYSGTLDHLVGISDILELVDEMLDLMKIHPLPILSDTLGRLEHALKQNKATANRSLDLFINFSKGSLLTDIGAFEVAVVPNPNLAKAVNSTAYTDVIFQCSHSKIHSHRCILSARSQHFKKMFTLGMKESTVQIISIPENSETFLSLINFLYTSVLQETPLDNLSLLTDLYTLSNLYDIPTLTSQLSKLLITSWNSQPKQTQLTEDYIRQVLLVYEIVREDSDSIELYQKTVEVLSCCWETLKNMNEWHHISQLDQDKIKAHLSTTCSVM